MGGKRKATRSRAAHLRELAQLKKQRREERNSDSDVNDEDYQFENEDQDAVEAVEPSMEHEEVEHTQRRFAAHRQRRCRKRVRGIGPQAELMAGWLIPDAGKEAEAAVERKAQQAAAEAAERSAALENVEKTNATTRALDLAAQAERERYKQRKANAAEETPRSSLPRQARTFCGASSSSSRKSRALSVDLRKKKSARTVTPAVAAVIARISAPKKRRFERHDIVNGETLSRVEWANVRRDHWELSKVYAMNIFLNLRRAGRVSQDAYNEAAKSVYTPNGKPVSWQTVRQWLTRFCAAGGKLHLDMRGRKPSTESYLSDNDVKEQAVAWLREQLRLMRAKNIDSPPLTVSTFHRFCNSTLLAPKMANDSRMKPISAQTALNWLHALGFGYKSHTKSIYFDGHERDDVVRDRMEKIATLKALDEVSVTFIGKNCDEARWPLLHPGEPVVVRVSQDESAYHSNDDCKSEWAEEGKGLSIKQKSRGSLLMVSMFISELHGILRCTKASPPQPMPAPSPQPHFTTPRRTTPHHTTPHHTTPLHTTPHHITLQACNSSLLV